MHEDPDRVNTLTIHYPYSTIEGLFAVCHEYMREAYIRSEDLLQTQKIVIMLRSQWQRMAKRVCRAVLEP